MLRPNDFVLDDDTPIQQVFYPNLDGERKGMGLVPRDYDEYPQEYLGPADIPLIPESEWSARIKDKVANKAQLSDIRDTADNGSQFAALDQNGQGYCWAYSTTACVMLLRAVMNQPYVRLSAHAIGCIVKGYRDEGGWCGLSAKFHRERGCPSVALWPEKSMSRSNDKPEVWANASLHRVTEDWMDLGKKDYDHTLTFQQYITCLLCNIPCAADFNWWGHSVCSMDAVDGVASFNAGLLRTVSGKLMAASTFDRRWATDVTAGFAPRILNSWTNTWGEKGTSVLAGSKGRPDGAVALRVTGASPT
jgi:hypothetical protein